MIEDTKKDKYKPKFVIFGDPNRIHAAEAEEEFRTCFKDKIDIIANCFGDSCSINTLYKADFAIVFGGDGTILSAARDLAETNIPVIGVNVGRLGFLAEFSIEELKHLFDRIIVDPSLIENRMLIRCNLLNDGKILKSATAVNDVVITAGEPFNMIETKICVQDQPLAGCMSDGLIISTPTGSTAYNLSAGGPILSAALSAMVITPVSPHSLSFRPIVIDASKTIHVRAERVNQGSRISLDGQVWAKLTTVDIVEIKRDKGVFRVVNNPLRTQWDTLAGKLRWAEKPRYIKRQN